MALNLFVDQSPVIATLLSGDCVMPLNYWVHEALLLAYSTLVVRAGRFLK
ncbi:MAG TPA: hypothetical protein VEI50_04250 [Nitrospiraceae bacterium]|nr:hypothetical protein [Nitrospiraceae bacterium]